MRGLLEKLGLTPAAATVLLLLGGAVGYVFNDVTNLSSIVHRLDERSNLFTQADGALRVRIEALEGLHPRN